MQKWFKEYYYNETYQDTTKKYFCQIRNKSPPDSSKFTGGEQLGGIKKKPTTIEHLEYVAEKMEYKALLADQEAKEARAKVEKQKAADAKKKAAAAKKAKGDEEDQQQDE